MLTQETLQRSWCADEITSALRNNGSGSTCLHGYLPPSDDFLRHLDNVWPSSVKVELAGLGVELEHIANASRLLRGIKVMQLDRSTAITLREATTDQAIKSCKGLSY